MRFAKYHALGNDYIVMDPHDFETKPSTDTIARLCHRNYGIGADGILLGPMASKSCDFGLRIYNSDGSEAEKSGNGLRIFARFLFDERLVSTKPFTIKTKGGKVTCVVSDDEENVTVEMGQVSFHSADIPIPGELRDVLNEKLQIEDKEFLFCAATVGNPHCIILDTEPTEQLARRFGPLIETHPLFANRTNVQFLKVLDRNNIEIQIWERGSGYTFASGSSSTAAAAVAHKLGKCYNEITVHMPGGTLEISFDIDLHATMRGPVTKIATGTVADEMLH